MSTATLERHHQFYDFERSEWQCQECDNCTDYCTGPSQWFDPTDL